MDWFTTYLEPEVLLILVLIAVAAGVIDTLAGGGGLITVPALLMAGLPPHLALGTNRLQACIGELTAAGRFRQQGVFEVDGLALGIAFTALGAIIGTIFTNWLPKAVLQQLLPVMMILITLYSIFSKSLGRRYASAGLLEMPAFMVSMGLLIGFYNGFFGPGTGSLWILAFVVLLGVTIKQASIATKPVNLAGNLVSLFVFVWYAQVDWALGLMMGLGQIAGALIGSHLVITKGSALIRPVFVSITLLMTIRLIWQSVS